MGHLRVKKSNGHFWILEKRKEKLTLRKRIHDLPGDRSDYRILGEARAVTFRGCCAITDRNIENFFDRVVAYRLKNPASGKFRAIAYRFNPASGKFRTAVAFYERRKR